MALALPLPIGPQLALALPLPIGPQLALALPLPIGPGLELAGAGLGVQPGVALGVRVRVRGPLLTSPADICAPAGDVRDHKPRSGGDLCQHEG